MRNEKISDKDVHTLIIIPSYNETQALAAFLSQLVPLLPKEIAIIIVDDSTWQNAEVIKGQIQELEEQFPNPIKLLRSNKKTGRGASVKRGMSVAVETFVNLKTILECDADGSHQPRDVVKIALSEREVDLLVGSRYLRQSRISNWPLGRRVFSKILNVVIPKVLNVPMSDITNGLRRYSINAVNKLLSEDSLNTGFVYLSEQAICLHRNNFSIGEEPIHFINRVLGESTVTRKEVLDSIVGVHKLVRNLKYE
jgi:dolichol-phosphate mannosyltransferase